MDGSDRDRPEGRQHPPFVDGLEALPIIRYPGVPTSGDVPGRLHLNECALPPSPRAIAAATEALAAANRYPDSRGVTVARALGDRLGLDWERIVVSCGSDEVLQMAATAVLRPGDPSVMPGPSFPRYRMSAALLGARKVEVPLTAEGACDARGLVDATATAKARIVYACTPNNPSGAMMDGDAVERLATGVAADVLLVIDEAYHEFGMDAGGPDVRAILERARPTGAWAITRTFSKAYALAGLRVGYALCSSPHVAGMIDRCQQVFAIAGPSTAAALAALDDTDHLARIITAVRTERDRLSAGLQRLGFAPLPSAANFVSFDWGGPAQPVIEALAADGLQVRDWRDPAWPTHIRLGCGTPADTDALLGALGRLRAAAA